MKKVKYGKRETEQDFSNTSTRKQQTKGKYGFYSLFKINNCKYTREQHYTTQVLSCFSSSLTFFFLATTSFTLSIFFLFTRETRCI